VRKFKKEEKLMTWETIGGCGKYTEMRKLKITEKYEILVKSCERTTTKVSKRGV